MSIPLTDTQRRELRIRVDVARARQEREHYPTPTTRKVQEILARNGAVMPRGYTPEKIGCPKSARFYRTNVRANEGCPKHARICTPHISTPRSDDSLVPVQIWDDGAHKAQIIELEDERKATRPRKTAAAWGLSKVRVLTKPPTGR